MKITTMKTESLEGAALDWAVAQAVGEPVGVNEYNQLEQTDRFLCCGGVGHPIWEPSECWSQCGPLIERHEVELCMVDGFGWCAEVRYALKQEIGGCSPQVAVCRAIVAAKLGDEVEVPEALAHG